MRLFLAIIPPPSVRARLLDSMAGIAGARWQSDSQLHLTLSFLGDVDQARTEALDATLTAWHPRSFSVQIDGVDHFEDRGHPTSLWARVEPDPALTALAASVARDAQAAGIAIERRRFVPHITLARLNRSSGPVTDWLSTHAKLSAPAWPVTHYHLMESILGPSGADYAALADYPLR